MHLDQERWPHVVLDGRKLFRECVARVEHCWEKEQTVRNDDERYNEKKRLDARWDSIFPVLGYICGNLSGAKIPLILLGLEDEREGNKTTNVVMSVGTKRAPYSSCSSSSSLLNTSHPWYYPTEDDLKAFCAAFGTTGVAPLFHIASLTPEAREPEVIKDMMDLCSEWKTIEWEDLRNGYRMLNGDLARPDISGIARDRDVRSDVTGDTGDRSNANNEEESERQHIDLVALGNPHLSLSECKTLATLMSQCDHTLDSPDIAVTKNFDARTSLVQKHPSTRIVATLGRRVHDQASRLGYLSPMKQFGVEFINDTCWCMLLDAPLIPSSGVILTNSAKYAHYGPSLTKRKYQFGGLRDCVDVASQGYFTKTRGIGGLFPHWLVQARAFTTDRVVDSGFNYYLPRSTSNIKNIAHSPILCVKSKWKVSTMIRCLLQTLR